MPDSGPNDPTQRQLRDAEGNLTPEGRDEQLRAEERDKHHRERERKYEEKADEPEPPDYDFNP